MEKVIQSLRMISHWDDIVGFTFRLDEDDLKTRIEYGKNLLGFKLKIGDWYSKSSIVGHLKGVENVLKAHGFYKVCDTAGIWFYCGNLKLNKKENDYNDYLRLKALNSGNRKRFYIDIEEVGKLYFFNEADCLKYIDYFREKKFFNKKEVFIDKIYTDENTYLTEDIKYYPLFEDRTTKYYITEKDGIVDSVYFYIIENEKIRKIECK